jgi:hypothetical protein
LIKLIVGLQLAHIHCCFFCYGSRHQELILPRLSACSICNIAGAKLQVEHHLMDSSGLAAEPLHQDDECSAYMLDVVEEMHALLMQANIHSISKTSLMETLTARELTSDLLHHLRATGRPLKNGGVGTIIAIDGNLVLKVRLQQC